MSVLTQCFLFLLGLLFLLLPWLLNTNFKVSYSVFCFVYSYIYMEKAQKMLRGHRKAFPFP